MRIIISALMLFACINSGAFALMTAQNAEKAAPYLAELIVAARSVISSHQTLINDPNIGDKGLTPEIIETQMTEIFLKNTGLKSIKDLGDESETLIVAALNSAKQSLMMNQMKINRKGLAFKGYTPAVFGREVGGLMELSTGIKLKQTSDRYRNVYNKPDDFEVEIMKKFASKDWEKGKTVGKVVGDYYRFMRPLYIEASCLKCHGDPKGELDVAGRKKEGYVLGEYRGAISVKIPIE